MAQFCVFGDTRSVIHPSVHPPIHVATFFLVEGCWGIGVACTQGKLPDVRVLSCLL